MFHIVVIVVVEVVVVVVVVVVVINGTLVYSDLASLTRGCQIDPDLEFVQGLRMSGMRGMLSDRATCCGCG